MLTQDLLRLYKVNRLHELGQNFIFNKNLCRKIISNIPEIQKLRICEIGPGPGIFTSIIKEYGPKELLLFEKDKRLEPVLREYNVIWGDYLKTKQTAELSELPTWVIGNLPFNVSSAILIETLKDMYFKKDLNPFGALFMFQKEVAERICAPVNNRNRNRLSLTSQLYSNVKYVCTVDKAVFSPIPKVDGAIVQFTQKNTQDVPDFDSMALFLRQLSLKPRKTLKLKPFESSRLHELSTDQLVTLYNTHNRFTDIKATKN